MMYSLPRLTGVALLALTVSGCSFIFGDDGYFRDRADDYRGAKMRPALKIPPNIRSSALGDAYVVPGVESHRVLAGNFEVPRPEQFVQSEESVVRIQKLGADRWILLDGSPGQVWPRLRGFLSISGLAVARTEAREGIIESDWLTPKGENLGEERYRFRVEKGVQRATSEIYILQDRRSTSPDWPSRSDSDSREDLMIRAVAQYLADSEAASSVSMVATQNVGAEGKVFIESNNNITYLRLLLERERAWASLGTALRKAGFKVRDWDQASGRYWVELARNKKDKDGPGWLSRVFGGDKKADARGYYVDMQQQGIGNMVITIEGQKRKISNKEEQALLSRIKGFIS